jgi:hypothetical protein
MLILKLQKYTTLPSQEDYVYLAADKIYTMEEIYSLDPKTKRLKFSHTAVDVGFDDHIIKVRNPAEQICKMIKNNNRK